LTWLDLSSRLDDQAVRELLAVAADHPIAETAAAACRRYAGQAEWELAGWDRDGTVVACIGTERAGPGVVRIRHLAVAADARGQGIGRSLIRRLCQDLQSGRLLVEADAETVGFFRKCGFSTAPLSGGDVDSQRFLCELKLGAAGGRT